jgi:hypothetical protein
MDARSSAIQNYVLTWIYESHGSNPHPAKSVWKSNLEDLQSPVPQLLLVRTSAINWVNVHIHLQSEKVGDCFNKLPLHVQDSRLWTAKKNF